RRPEHIDFVTSIDEDLARRDFTVNAIAFEPMSETLIDPFDGVSDLRAQRLRAVGDPAQRFAEDGLRVLRAARLVATLEFELEPGASLRRWLRRIGPEQHPLACQLERAHRRALGAPAAELAALDTFEQRASAELAQNPPLSLSALAIDGKQLIAHAGYRPGR